MRPRVEYGNPYRESLLRVAFDQGKRARLLGQIRVRVFPGCSDRTLFAYEAGYLGLGWHRAPNGQVKWHKRGV